MHAIPDAEYRNAVDGHEYVTAGGSVARLRDAGVTVAEILDDLADGPIPDEIVRSRPGLTRAAVEAALRFAAELARH